MENQDQALADTVKRYLRSVFALVLYLAKCSEGAAYQLTLAGFLDAVRQTPEAGEGLFVKALLQTVIQQCRKAAPTPFPADPEFLRLLEVKKITLPLVRQALFSLDFNPRALLLLRDQLNISYEDIGVILGLTPKTAKSEASAARTQLREKMGEVLSRARGQGR